MDFYLGTHQPGWLGRYHLRFFVSRRRLAGRRRLPVALREWALDSGGFTELRLHGAWQLSAAAYAAEVRRYRDTIGHLAWAAPQDWMCEPAVLRRTGRSVTDHQAATVANYLDLRALAPDLPFIPVLQGWTLADYLRCIDRYTAAGVDLTAAPRVGLGSVCRRQATREVAELVATLHGLGLRLHGFGVKISGLDRYGDFLASADSLAWSYEARRRPALWACTHLWGRPHAHCNNCIHWAEQWAAFVVEPKINPRLYAHPMVTAVIPQWRRSGPQRVQLPLIQPDPAHSHHPHEDRDRQLTLLPTP
jgi:hypothetical protein